MYATILFRILCKMVSDLKLVRGLFIHHKGANTKNYILLGDEEPVVKYF